MHGFKRLLCLACCIFFIGLGAAASAEEYANPLLNPDLPTQYASLPEKMLNILLLGIDYGHSGYWGSGNKKALEDCHTDAVMVVSIHQDSRKVDFVSIPRDTLTYVPGVRGIYKLNGAVNCGDTVEDGLDKVCNTVSWILGGVKIDYYCAVDMNVMEELGDAIGGIDFDLEMSYTGHSGTHYAKGMHHLDGTGIMDYLRSRTNATVNSNDIGRTNRQRALMIAIFEKLKSNYSLILKAVQTAMDHSDGFYTNLKLSGADYLTLAPLALNLNAEDIGSYVITGKYRTALKGWNFTFTDQDNRQTVIREVYGINVEPLPYVDYEYTKWLVDSGLHTIHVISVATKLKDYLNTVDLSGLSAENNELANAFLEQYADTRDSFETAAESMAREDTNVMIAARKALQKSGAAVAKALQYPEKLPWSSGKYWYTDSYVNEAILDWQ